MMIDDDSVSKNDGHLNSKYKNSQLQKWQPEKFSSHHVVQFLVCQALSGAFVEKKKKKLYILAS